jgi:acyl-CoA thioesterase II
VTVSQQANLLDVLKVEQIADDTYRADHVVRESTALYGGQVAAQALRAAGLTVPAGRLPHSLHGYFLLGGDAAVPTIFKVERDRDGRSFSARRVVALQDGRVLFNMSCSFHVTEDGPVNELHPVPPAADPETLSSQTYPWMLSIDTRIPAQPVPDSAWPTRFWARATIDLGDDPLIHACVLTYVSDNSSGLAGLPDVVEHSGASLDHAMWFHRPSRLDDWVLFNLVPSSTMRGRGYYTGTVHDRRGQLTTDLAQELLFRFPRADGKSGLRH